jgi:predicted nucleic acid-binding protein
VSVYLVDTDVISTGAPSKRLAAPALIRWMGRNSDQLFLSAITVAEITDGIAKARREGARRKATALAEWLEAVLHLYGVRVLPFDVAVARVAGRLSDRARSEGRSPGFPDLAIAATAAAHHLTLLTRNLRHFAPLGIPAYDPFAALPRG